jgi:hypothetical protein
VRTTAHGISAGLGKLGAFIGVLLFPPLEGSGNNIAPALGAAAITAVLGLALTWITLPETNQRSLESFYTQSQSHAARLRLA